MKKYLAFVLAALFMILTLSGCGVTRENPGAATQEETEPAQMVAPKKDEVRAVWLTYDEIGKLYKDHPKEADFTKAAGELIQALKEKNFNRVIAHVRAYSDSFYNSKVFPWSKTLTGTEGKDPGLDPLKILLEQAHKAGLKLEAWVNPYRISYNTDLTKLSADNPAKRWLTDSEKSNDSWVIQLKDKGLYYNPAIPQVRKMVVEGVQEILDRYDVDGIHLDDYFYPSTEASMDQAQYQAYQKDGGKSSLAQWRRENVNQLVKELYQTVKKKSKNLVLGISPASNRKNNLDVLYADVETWATQEGYVDYLCPQIYFGFFNQAAPFMSEAKSWEKLIDESKVTFYIGLPLYKAGKEDEYAGGDKNEKDAPINEFLNHSNIVARQVRYLRQLDTCQGFFLFSYSDLFQKTENSVLLKERENLWAVMKLSPEDTK